MTLLILSIVLASILLYLYAGFKFIIYREKGRVRESLACIEEMNKVKSRDYYSYCSYNHHNSHYDFPWAMIMLTWPFVLIHRAFWHDQPDIGERISALAEAAVEKETMHVVVEGNGEQD